MKKYLILSSILLSSCGHNVHYATDSPGPTGATGASGKSSLVVGVSASLSDCPTGGTTFLTGYDTNGDGTLSGREIGGSYNVCNGTQGVVGPSGPVGSTGASGTSVTTVKFCNDDTSAFPEYGLVVGGSIYAVYWGTAPYSPSTNEAFLALIKPGSYRSTGGNGCAFTVNANGTVTEN